MKKVLFVVALLYLQSSFLSAKNISLNTLRNEDSVLATRLSENVDFVSYSMTLTNFYLKVVSTKSSSLLSKFCSNKATTDEINLLMTKLGYKSSEEFKAELNEAGLKFTHGINTIFNSSNLTEAKRIEILNLAINKFCNTLKIKNNFNPVNCLASYIVCTSNCAINSGTNPLWVCVANCDVLYELCKFFQD